MIAKFIMGFSVVLLGAILMPLQDVSALLYLGSTKLYKGSVNCDLALGGGGNQNSIDGVASCSIAVREATRQCVNKAGNAEPSQSDNFAEHEAPIVTEVDSQLTFKTKNGTSLSQLSFTDAELLAIIQAAHPDFSLDPTLACLNRSKNWTVKWAITKLDLEAMIDTVLVRCKKDTNADGKCEDSNGDGKVDSNDAVRPIPVWPSAASQFPPVPAHGGPVPYHPCDPAISGLKFYFLDANGGINFSDPGTGIVNECAAYIDARFVNDDFPGLGEGGCKVGLTGETSYTCSCADHGGQTGNVSNIGPYRQVTGIFTAADSQCTGEAQLMK